MTTSPASALRDAVDELLDLILGGPPGEPKPGMDCQYYPGDKLMQQVFDSGAFSWTGFYLLAPNHSDAGWMAARGILVEQGWGLLPIYLGQMRKDFSAG